jgi:hypothetical protein
MLAAPTSRLLPGFGFESEPSSSNPLTLAEYLYSNLHNKNSSFLTQSQFTIQKRGQQDCPDIPGLDKKSFAQALLGPYTASCSEYSKNGSTERVMNEFDPNNQSQEFIAELLGHQVDYLKTIGPQASATTSASKASDNFVFRIDFSTQDDKDHYMASNGRKMKELLEKFQNECHNKGEAFKIKVVCGNPAQETMYQSFNDLYRNAPTVAPTAPITTANAAVSPTTPNRLGLGVSTNQSNQGLTFRVDGR